MGKRILVTGATGRLGREVVQQLKSHGHFVRAIGRDESRLRSLCATADERIVWDAVKTEELPGLCRGMEQVVSCMGASVIPTLWHGRKSFGAYDTPANLRLIEAAQQERVRRFLYVSVFTDGRLGENDFVKGHEEVVDGLRASRLEYAVVRPTGYFSSLVQIMREPSWGLIPEYQRGQARTNPIHEADLAAFCIELLEKEGDRIEANVGGPEVLTRRQIAELVHLSRVDKRTAVRVPVTSLRAASFVLRPFNRRVSQLMDFIADVLSDDYVAPTYGVRRLSEYLELEPALA
jgi:uncharacterized protein YbjT (DUF2867 family)